MVLKIVSSQETTIFFSCILFFQSRLDIAFGELVTVMKSKISETVNQAVLSEFPVVILCPPFQAYKYWRDVSKP